MIQTARQHLIERMAAISFIALALPVLFPDISGGFVRYAQCGLVLIGLLTATIFSAKKKSLAFTLQRANNRKAILYYLGDKHRDF
jgi:hypothetical protein